MCTATEGVRAGSGLAGDRQVEDASDVVVLEQLPACLGEVVCAGPAEDRQIRALTLFSAVHGIISISLEGRFVGIPATRLESELDDFVALLAAGATAGRR